MATNDKSIEHDQGKGAPVDQERRDGPFTSIQADYWSTTETNPGVTADLFSFGSTGQFSGNEVNPLSAWAVR